MMGPCCLVCHITTERVFLNRESRGSPDSTNILSRGLVRKVPTPNASAVDRVYDRQHGLYCGVTHEASTDYLKVVHGTMKLDNCCTGSATG
jgi:hypothetical protein